MQLPVRMLSACVIHTLKKKVGRERVAIEMSIKGNAGGGVSLCNSSLTNHFCYHIDSACCFAEIDKVEKSSCDHSPGRKANRTGLLLLLDSAPLP